MYFKNNTKAVIKGFLTVGVLLLTIIFCSVSEIRISKEKQNNGASIQRDFTLNVIEIPEGLADIEVDTLLTNDFRINIHNKTSAERISHLEYKANSVVKNVYKGYASDVKIYYKQQLVFEQPLEKSFFEKKDESSFWDKAILQTVEVDELKSIDQPLIHIRFFNPVQDAFKAYQIRVDSEGVYTLQPIDGTHVS